MTNIANCRKQFDNKEVGLRDKSTLDLIYFGFETRKEFYYLVQIIQTIY